MIRRHGSGTYVAPQRVTADPVTLTGFSAVLQQQGRAWRTQVLSVGYATPDTGVLDALRIPDAVDSVIRLVRVRTIDDVPSTLETSWLPAATAARLMDEPLRDGSLFETLRADGRFEPDHAAERLSAVGLQPSAARRLDSRSGSAAFGVERTTFSASGAPLEFARTLLRADRFAFVNQRPAAAMGSFLDAWVRP